MPTTWWLSSFSAMPTSTLNNGSRWATRIRSGATIMDLHLSGPVSIPKLFDARNRLFFTSNFEALHDRTTNQVVVPVATDLMRAGNFTQISQTIYDPRTRVYNAAGVGSASPYPGNIIPASDISPQAHRAAQVLPEHHRPRRQPQLPQLHSQCPLAHRFQPVQPAHRLGAKRAVDLVRPFQLGQ